MALKSIIYKATLNISDLDRHHYAEYPLTMALHPSETEQRMMMRLLAFALYADEDLSFTRGLCVDDEPDLWQYAPNGEIERWIEVGLPSEKRLRKACSRAKEVVLLVYGSDQQVDPWWQGIKRSLIRFDNLRVLRITETDSAALTALVARQMRLQCTVQDGQLWFTSDAGSAELTPAEMQPTI
ncbi:YaeQ protein [Marinobacterium lacunae]|uniref:YaeQ protein n=1 Tax=Marinobacterium lacunae TaxID=1232683 RepID=A0A081FZS1_9GAMM|nr:YaeQ family protein [Marinobacterium lacunae]KEA64026.1 YaeQ protein [Marinobacterium lacunae]MBR9885285.1 YaeQ family protein [Oceanospirillales bacterium]